MKRMLSVVVLLLACACWGQNAKAPRLSALHLPKGVTVPKITRSPDGRYGVTVPDRDHWEPDQKQNKIVDLRTGSVLGAIDAQSAPEHANHVQMEAPNWSRDGSLLLWRVEEKWTPWALMLVKIGRGKVLWQVDIMALAADEIDARTKKAAPRRYQAARKRNSKEPYGRFENGFAVQVSPGIDPGKPLTFPLKINVSLESNPQQLEDYPKAAQLDSELTGVATADGKFTVTKFALTRAAKL